MVNSKQKVYVLGVDQLNLKIVRLLVNKGKLPNFKKLLNQGTANQILPAFPAATAINWPTISTGAEASTHGITKWFVKLENNEEIHAYWSHAVNAETIWEAAEKQGIKSVVINYPSSTPSRLKNGYVINGFPSTSYGEGIFEITPAKCYTTVNDIPGAEIISLSKHDISEPNYEKNNILKSKIKIISKHGKEKTFFILIVDSVGLGYDKVFLCRDQNLESCISELKLDQWSDWIYEKFMIENNETTGTIRFKLIDLSKDGKNIKIYRSQIMPLNDFIEPTSISNELSELCGPYIDYVTEFFYLSGGIDFKTFIEEAEYHSQWIAKAGIHLMKNKDCGLFYTHVHFLDDTNHFHIGYIDPSWPRYKAENADMHWKIIEESYKVIDNMVGYFLDNMDSDSYLMVVADHGNMPGHRIIDTKQFLIEKKYTVLTENKNYDTHTDNSKISDSNEEWKKKINWEKTTAYVRPDDSTIFINAEGEKYKTTQKKLLTDLRTWVDPKTGQTPIALALKKEDATILGLWGDSIGDIVLVLEDGYSSWTLPHEPLDETISDFKNSFSGAHGNQHLTSQSNINSHLAMLILKGPGIKEGYERSINQSGYIKTKDIVSIICHILKIDPPLQNQGTIAYDLFQNKDLKRQKLDPIIKKHKINNNIDLTETNRHYFSLIKYFPWEK